MTQPASPPPPTPAPAAPSWAATDLAAVGKDLGLYGAPVIAFIIVILNTLPAGTISPAVQAIIAASITLATSLLAIAKSRQVAVAKAAVAVTVAPKT